MDNNVLLSPVIFTSTERHLINCAVVRANGPHEEDDLMLLIQERANRHPVIPIIDITGLQPGVIAWQCHDGLTEELAIEVGSADFQAVMQAITSEGLLIKDCQVTDDPQSGYWIMQGCGAFYHGN